MLKGHQLYLWVLAIIICSCGDQEITLPLPVPDNKLTVYAVLEPDSAIYVQVSKILPLISKDTFELLSTAKVLIKAGNEIFKSVYTERGYLIEKLNPVQGVQYTLEVSTDGFPEAVAYASLPAEVSIDSVTIDTKSKPFHNYGSPIPVFPLHVNFNDPAAKPNYYFITINRLEKDSTGVYFTEPVSVESSDPIANPIELWGDYNSISFDGNVIDGKSYSFEILLNKDDLQGHQTDGTMLIVKLYSMSQELYRYYTSLGLQVSNANNIFSEPSNVYTNIQSGLGVFGGQIVSTDSIMIDKIEFNFNQ